MKKSNTYIDTSNTFDISPCPNAFVYSAIATFLFFMMMIELDIKINLLFLLISCFAVNIVTFSAISYLAYKISKEYNIKIFKAFRTYVQLKKAIKSRIIVGDAKAKPNYETVKINKYEALLEAYKLAYATDINFLVIHLIPQTISIGIGNFKKEFTYAYNVKAYYKD